MKKIFIITLLIACSVGAFAQNKIGLEFGASSTIFIRSADHPEYTYRNESNMNPTAHLWYHRKIDKHVYLGAALGVENYSFYYSKAVDTSRTDIMHRSTFITLTPTLDFGLGRHQRWHIFIGMDMGFRNHVQQTTSTFANQYQATPDMDTSTTQDVSKFIFRFNLGLRQQYPISKDWYITLSECLSATPTALTAAPAPINNLYPGYFMIQMGIMHKFRSFQEAPSKE
jgi:hypothetical protein